MINTGNKSLLEQHDIIFMAMTILNTTLVLYNRYQFTNRDSTCIVLTLMETPVNNSAVPPLALAPALAPVSSLSSSSTGGGCMYTCVKRDRGRG